MIERLAKQLDNPNPNQRLRAVQGLAQQNDKRALTLLQAVSTREKNADVRKAAENAINEFKRRTGIMEAPQLPDKVKTDLKVVQQSKELLNMAMKAYSGGDNLRAAKALRQAFTINPALSRDNYAMSLLSSVTELDGDEALNALMRSRRLESIPGVAASIRRMKSKA